MTVPPIVPPPGPPSWLAPAAVAAWLKLTTSAADDLLLAACCAAVEPQVQSARPDMWQAVVADDDMVSRVYVPDGEVHLAAVMLAAKVFRRRNSPGGMETSFDQIAYVARFDPEIERALHQGRSRRPAVG